MTLWTEDKLNELASRLDGKRIEIPFGPAKGMRWKIDRHYRFEFALGIYDLTSLGVLSECLSPGQVFYDVGSCLGYYAMVAATLLGGEGQVFTFEPVEESRQILRAHAELNGLSQIVLEPFAVSDRDTQVTLHIDADRRSRSSLIPDYVRGAESRKVEAISLDSFCESRPSPDFIKIDVEGAAHSVLNGFRNAIERSRPAFLIEVHGDSEKTEVIRILSGWNYEIAQIAAEKAPHFLAMPNEKLGPDGMKRLLGEVALKNSLRKPPDISELIQAVLSQVE